MRLFTLLVPLLLVMAKRKASSLSTNGVKAGKAVKALKVTAKAAKVVDSCASWSRTVEKVLLEAETLPATRGGWKLYDGLKHLVESDKKFADLISAHGIPEAFRSVQESTSTGVVPLPIPTGAAEEHYFSLLKIIIYQQLSAKSAEPILKRFLSTFKVVDGRQLTPQMVKDAKFETVMVDGKRKVLLNGEVSGLSEGKARYIKDLTDHYLDADKLMGVNLTALSDDELRRKLLCVNGLGPWSVDMFMLFDLHRPNVLPMGDLVVRKGVAKFHGLPDTYFENKKNLLRTEELCRSWAPYSSLATCYMWKVKDSLGVQAVVDAED